MSIDRHIRSEVPGTSWFAEPSGGKLPEITKWNLAFWPTVFVRPSAWQWIGRS